MLSKTTANDDREKDFEHLVWNILDVKTLCRQQYGDILGVIVLLENNYVIVLCVVIVLEQMKHRCCVSSASAALIERSSYCVTSWAQAQPPA